MKLKAPANFGGFTHAGESYEADENGIVELPDTMSMDVAYSHGLLPYDGAQDKPEGGKKGGKKAAAPAGEGAGDGGAAGEGAQDKPEGGNNAGA